MKKTIKLILAATIAAALMTGCGSRNDNSDITPTPSSSPMTDMQQNNNNNTSGTAKSGMDDMGDAAKDLTDGAGNAVKGAVDGVQNAVGSMTGNN